MSMKTFLIMSVLEKQYDFIFVRVFMKHLLAVLYIISPEFMSKERKFVVAT